MSAIFLLLLIATLIALVASFSNTQQVTTTQDLQGAKAYQAARAGVEWGLHQVLIVGAGAAGACAGTNAPTFAGIPGFTVTVTRALDGASPYTENGAAVNICRITSKATYPDANATNVGKNSYIEREIQVTIDLGPLND